MDNRIIPTASLHNADETTIFGSQESNNGDKFMGINFFRSPEPAACQDENQSNGCIARNACPMLMEIAYVRTAKFISLNKEFKLFGFYNKF